MSTTPLMGLEYPTHNQEPWYPVFEAFVLALDREAYAGAEARSTVLIGGGSVALDLGTNVLSWDAAFEFVVALGGKILTVDAGSVILNEGEFLYVDVSRPILKNDALAIQKASKLSSSSSRQLIGFRRNDTFWIANGSFAVGV